MLPSNICGGKCATPGVANFLTFFCLRALKVSTPIPSNRIVCCPATLPALPSAAAIPEGLKLWLKLT